MQRDAKKSLMRELGLTRIIRLCIMRVFLGDDGLALHMMKQRLRKAREEYLNAIRYVGIHDKTDADVEKYYRPIFDMINDQIQIISTIILMDKCERLNIALKIDSSDWSYSDQIAGRSLSAAKLSEIRKAIRTEKNERRAIWEAWAKLAGATVATATGLVGAIIGLVSILHK